MIAKRTIKNLIQDQHISSWRSLAFWLSSSHFFFFAVLDLNSNLFQELLWKFKLSNKIKTWWFSNFKLQNSKVVIIPAFGAPCVWSSTRAAALPWWRCLWEWALCLLAAPLPALPVRCRCRRCCQRQCCRRRHCWGEPAAQSVYLVRSSLLLPPGGVQSTPTIVIMVRSTAITTSANACEAASAGTTASTIQNPSVALTWSDEKESGRYSACCMAQRFIWWDIVPKNPDWLCYRYFTLLYGPNCRLALSEMIKISTLGSSKNLE